jgi:hypothetical protein
MVDIKLTHLLTHLGDKIVIQVDGGSFDTVE